MYEILTGTAVFPRSEYVRPTLTKILSGQKPVVPDECGSVMQELIPRCWSMDPGKRPTFNEIIGHFKTATLRILPRADEAKLGQFVEDIEEWEAKDAVQSQTK
jgi:hypothetical protein